MHYILCIERESFKTFHSIHTRAQKKKSQVKLLILLHYRFCQLYRGVHYQRVSYSQATALQQLKCPLLKSISDLEVFCNGYFTELLIVNLFLQLSLKTIIYEGQPCFDRTKYLQQLCFGLICQSTINLCSLTWPVRPGSNSYNRFRATTNLDRISNTAIINRTLTTWPQVRLKHNGANLPNLNLEQLIPNNTHLQAGVKKKITAIVHRL